MVMTFCGKCGAKNPDDSAFCFKCGAALVKGESTPLVDEPVHPQPVVDNTPKSEPVQEKVTPEKAKEMLANVDMDDVVIIGGNYSTDPADISRYREYTWVCIILSYLIGAYFLFFHQFHFDGGLNGLDSTLLGLMTGEFSLSPAFSAIYIIAVILFVLSFFPVCGAFCGLMGIFTIMSIKSVTGLSNVIIGTLETHYQLSQESMIIGMIVVFVVLAIGIIGIHFMQKATIVDAVRKGKLTTGSLLSFYKGSKN